MSRSSDTCQTDMYLSWSMCGLQMVSLGLNGNRETDLILKTWHCWRCCHRQKK